jgi:TM2 domain-containing membrane protein YozV
MENYIKFNCPSCQQSLEVWHDPTGSTDNTVACPSCASSITVPVSSIIATPPPIARSVKQCAYCGETILSQAMKCKHCGELVNQFVQGNIRPRNMRGWDKSKNVAGVLALFFGGIGVHKFYMRRPGLGLLYIIFCWTYIPSIVALFEGIIYFCQTQEAFDNKYYKP